MDGSLSKNSGGANQNNMTFEQCPGCARLEDGVSTALEQVSSIAKEQVGVVRTADQKVMMRLDKELEILMGEKERLMGALFEHRREHRHQN